MNIEKDRSWERFWKYKPKANNQHDWFMVWADIKLLGKSNAIFYEHTKFK
jgi:hypothetical protein